MSKTILKKFILLAYCILLLVHSMILSGCGGGFGTDCAKAHELRESVFGPDSLIRR